MNNSEAAPGSERRSLFFNLFMFALTGLVFVIYSCTFISHILAGLASSLTDELREYTFGSNTRPVSPFLISTTHRRHSLARLGLLVHVLRHRPEPIVQGVREDARPFVLHRTIHHPVDLDPPFVIDLRRSSYAHAIVPHGDPCDLYRLLAQDGHPGDDVRPDPASVIRRRRLPAHPG